MAKKLLVFALLMALLLLIFAYKTHSNRTALKQEASIKVGQTEINIEIADTDSEKAKGLSGKPFLGENEGMLFIFPTKSQPSFWMKDMLIPLDMIWITDGKITYIHENVPTPMPEQTNANLPLYRPPEPINYVLEVNAGFAQKHGVKAGDSIDLTNLE